MHFHQVGVQKPSLDRKLVCGIQLQTNIIWSYLLILFLETSPFASLGASQLKSTSQTTFVVLDKALIALFSRDKIRPIADKMATTSRVVTEDGIEWHCERQGRGPHLVLIPSGEGDCSNFAKVASLLASDFTVTTFDMPGMSRSTAPEEAMSDLTATKIASQVIGLMDELAIDTTTVYGCSSGGLIALSLAAFHPERIQSAVVHEVPLRAKLNMFADKTDDQIVDTCRHLFADVMVEDRGPWLTLGTEYHGRLDRNYLTWVHRYVGRVERSFSKDELRRRPIHWTVGELSPMGFYFENVVVACGAGIPIGLLPCRHFPQVTIPDTLAEHIRTAAKSHLQS